MLPHQRILLLSGIDVVRDHYAGMDMSKIAGGSAFQVLKKLQKVAPCAMTTLELEAGAWHKLWLRREASV